MGHSEKGHQKKVIDVVGVLEVREKKFQGRKII